MGVWQDQPFPTASQLLRQLPSRVKRTVNGVTFVFEYHCVGVRFRFILFLKLPAAAMGQELLHQMGVRLLVSKGGIPRSWFESYMDLRSFRNAVLYLLLALREL